MDILVVVNLKFAIDHNRKTTRMRTERIPVPKWNQYFILRLQLFSEDDNDIPLGANNTLWTPSRMVQYDFTRRKNCHILYSVMFYKKYDAIFTCGTPIMSCTTVHPTQEIHTWKEITSHSPHHNVQVDIYKDPGALPPNTEATHRRDKCQNDVQKYFSLQEWERSAVVRFIMQIENYTS